MIVWEGKGGKYREVPLSKEVHVALDLYLQKREEDGRQRLFLDQRGPVNVPGVQYLVAKYAYLARLQDITLHCLRHINPYIANTFGKRCKQDEGGGAGSVTIS